MNVLWIPHTPWREGSVGRDRHLIRHLRHQNHNVATVSWPLRSDWTQRPLSSFSKSLTRRRTSIMDVPAFSVRRLPDVTHGFRSQIGCWGVNQRLFHDDVRWAAAEFGADVIVTGFSYPMTGYPPFELNAPIVFDYLDLVDWSNHPHRPDLPYLRHADAVLGVSDLTCQRARKYGASVYALPNGADIPQFRKATGTRVREEYGLEDATVVSLIGLSVGEEQGQYFVDAVIQAKKQEPSLHCLLVGESPSLRLTTEARDPEGKTFTHVGKVSYNEVAEYYAASDIGLYPAPGSTHDDGRSPIKVFEYSAQGTPVVAAPIREITQLSFDNIILAEPNSESFAEGILAAVQKGATDVEEVNEYDWSVLAQKLAAILEKSAKKKTKVQARQK